MSDDVIDWDILSEADKAKVAVQIYTPAFTTQSVGMADIHAKIPVSVEHRSARIDAKLAEIIRFTLNNGMETIACCENRLNNNVEDTESAWISFLSAEHGGNRFAEILTSAAGIPHRVSPTTFAARFNLATPIQRVMLRMPAVHFRPQDIECIREAIGSVV